MYRVFSCLTVEHDWRLVILAAAVCFLASVTAVNLFHRARNAQGRSRLVWLATAGTATGCGIWATHFVAMLAYKPGFATAYHVGLTVLSLVAAIVITAVGLGFAAFAPTRWRAPIGGAFVGGGVATMHYLGMSALELPGHIAWSPGLVAASILLGVVLGAAALQVAIRSTGMRGILMAGLLLALAIISHHFTAMGAVEIVPDPTHTIDAMSLSPLVLALAVAGVAIVILALSFVGTILDARFHDQRVRLDAALSNMRHGLLMFDRSGRLILHNQRFAELYRIRADAIHPGCTLRDIFALRKQAGTFDGDPDRFMPELIGAARHFGGDAVGQSGDAKTEHKVTPLPDGRMIQVTNQLLPNGGWVSTHTDISETVEATRELERTKTFLNTIVENVPATLLVKDAHDLRYLLVNRAAETLLGMPRENVIGKTAHEIFQPHEADAIHRRDLETLLSGRNMFVENMPLQTPSQGRRVVTTKRIAIGGDEDDRQYLLSVVEDVTERRRVEEQVEFLALHDPLTGLPNRTAFADRLAATLEQARKEDVRFAVLCIDLDRFKEVNDVFGHGIGDELLREVAKRLREAASDAFVARQGGDEFTVILATGEQPRSAEALADRLLHALAEDIVIDGQQLRIGMSIGVAIYPSDGSDGDTLVSNADAALCRLKTQGRGSFCFFEATMDQRLRERRALQHELRSAIPNGELVLHYQPQAAIGGEVNGFEALVRWLHPTRGLIGPSMFIPIAEESGAILAIGEWTLREASREAASWPRPLRIAVNLSPVQFQHGDLPTLVHQVLLETGLQPNRLELEITEGVLIGDFSRAVSILSRLKALGVRIAMDDFGTGYSSLSYLQSFPFDKIKIDRAFISNVDCNPQSAAIVRAVIGLGRGLDLPIVAEGVETKDQLAFLSRESCNEVQGYLVGRPLAIDKYDEVVGREPATPPVQKLRLVG